MLVKIVSGDPARNDDMHGAVGLQFFGLMWIIAGYDMPCMRASCVLNRIV